MTDRITLIARLGALLESSEGDAKAVLRDALTQLVADSAVVDRAEERKAKDRKRKHSTESTETVESTEGAESVDGFPLPPVSLLPPTPPNNPSSPPPPSESPVRPAIRVARPRKAATPGAPSWVAEGSAWWHENVGDIELPRFGKALKRIVGLFGWPAVFPDLQKWVAERKETEKACRVEWYASEASARLTAEPPPMWDPVRMELTAYGERMTRPAGVAR